MQSAKIALENGFIPFDCVCKIGVDVILVELYINENTHPKGKDKNYSTHIQNYNNQNNTNFTEQNKK